MAGIPQRGRRGHCPRLPGKGGTALAYPEAYPEDWEIALADPEGNDEPLSLLTRKMGVSRVHCSAFLDSCALALARAGSRAQHALSLVPPCCAAHFPPAPASPSTCPLSRTAPARQEGQS